MRKVVMTVKLTAFVACDEDQVDGLCLDVDTDHLNITTGDDELLDGSIDEYETTAVTDLGPVEAAEESA